jgi:hypothetical protein
MFFLSVVEDDYLFLIPNQINIVLLIYIYSIIHLQDQNEH